MFINYDANTDSPTINTYRKAGFYAGDIGDVAEALTTNAFSATCELEGALAALEDGEFWAGSSASQEALEQLHDLISRHEDYPACHREGYEEN